jgi:hypothetical protein
MLSQAYFLCLLYFLQDRITNGKSEIESWNPLAPMKIFSLLWYNVFISIIIIIIIISSIGCGAVDHKFSPCMTILGKIGYLLLLKHAIIVPHQTLNVCQILCA